MNDLDAFQESTFLLKPLTSGQGFYSSMIFITIFFRVCSAEVYFLQAL